ncbi:globin domain-containing protein [Streptomyces sp. I05A-00742]|uniref:globin domain-containing protein n=1 Tax=Streptomyces sp. I05A-00742 TaxID=2732853 RepID=UPI002017E1D3|nr:globin domain-containing protein [Streptomyces sp. I05A-00742]
MPVDMQVDMAVDTAVDMPTGLSTRLPTGLSTGLPFDLPTAPTAPTVPAAPPTPTAPTTALPTARPPIGPSAPAGPERSAESETGRPTPRPWHELKGFGAPLATRGLDGPDGTRPDAATTTARASHGAENDAGVADSAEAHDSDTALSPHDSDTATSSDSALIRGTLAEIEPIADKVVSHFYALLFLHHPALRPLFPPAMDAQRDRLFKALLTAARHADDTAALTTYLSRLGRGHRKYGTRPEHYPAVGESLIGALTRYATRTWNEAAEAAWVRVYTAISQIMIDAAAEDELTSPPWWHAEIVGHELRTPDIAVITLRPDQPYPFLAGQYTSVETPWWPRIWRHYSFSAAPRPDGLLSFHVKAVPAGWVSGALVHRARPGDVLRLGPPAGSMIVDHTTDNGLLCLGGGTGIAPIKALVEDVAEHGGTRPVEVFYGARHDGDLYDMDTMRELDRAHPWLSVRPVVSDGPTRALSGQLPYVVRDHGPWNSYDAYLSGPPAMIRSGVDTLVGIGIPSHRIRHDSIDGLLAEAKG